MPDASTPPYLFTALRLAISDPGSVLPREQYEEDWDGHPKLESVTRWSARAVAEAIRPFLAKQHDPAVNCDCEPGDLARKGICEYRMLGDAVGEAFNPPDGDEAEVAILIDAVERAAQYVGFQDCECTMAMVADREPCARCAVLGQLGRTAVQR